MSRRLPKLVLATLATMALLWSTAIAQDTVRMWTFLNPEGTAPREVALAQIIEDFEAANPDITIEVEQQVWDQMTPKFLAAHSAGNAPDIIWISTDLLGDVIDSGSVADLNDLFIHDWSDERRADITDSYYNLCNVDGAQYCLFTSRNYIGVLYRKDIFEEAGLDAAAIRTWEDFRAAAEALTATDANGNVTRWGFGQQFSPDFPDPQMYVPLVLEQQGDIFNPDGTPAWATEAGVAAMTEMTSYVSDAGPTPPAAVNYSAEDLYEQFAAGRMAMITGASVRVSTMQQQVGVENVGFMLWPSSDGESNAPSAALGWGVGVWSGSEVAASAGKFVDYMTGPEADALWVEVGGQIPMRQSTIEAMADFFSQPANEYVVAAANGITHNSWVAPIAFPIGGYRQDLNQAAQDVVLNGVDPAKALEDAEADFIRRNQ